MPGPVQRFLDWVSGYWTVQHLDAAWSLQMRRVMRVVRMGADSNGVPNPTLYARLHGGFFIVATDPTTAVHQWSLCMPVSVVALGTGTSCTVRPCKNAWSDVDSFYDTLTVDYGTQTVAPGDVGFIAAGTSQDAEKLMFIKTGGSSASTSSPGLWGDASDGNITLPASGTASFLPDYNGGGATAHGIQYVYNDGTTWFYKLKRDCFFDTLTLSANVILLVSENYVPWGLALAGAGRMSSSAYDWAALGTSGPGYTQMGADGAPYGGGSAGNGTNGYTIDFTSAAKKAGDGGLASVGHAGGVGGVDQPHYFGARVHTFPLNFLGVGLGSAFGTEPNFYSSSGGGGGYDANGGSGTGGAVGGGAARSCFANFKDTSGFTGKFAAEGSPGGKGADCVISGSPKCAGGGGASGAIVAVNTATPSGSCTWTTSAKGGLGGTGVNGAANGTNGTDGVVMISRPA